MLASVALPQSRHERMRDAIFVWRMDLDTDQWMLYGCHSTRRHANSLHNMLFH